MKKIVSFMLVLILSFGTVASVCAQENDYNENNLKGQAYRIIDVNVVEGRNTMSCSVTPNAFLTVELTNAIFVPVYTYSTNAPVGGFSTTYISSTAGRGRYRGWNNSSYAITLIAGSFNGA